MVVIIPRCSALFLGSKTWRNVSCVKQNIWMSLFIYKLKNKQKSLHFNKNKMLGEKQVVWWITAIAGSWTCPDLIESGCQPCLMLSSFPTLNSLQSANLLKLGNSAADVQAYLKGITNSRGCILLLKNTCPACCGQWVLTSAHNVIFQTQVMTCQLICYGNDCILPSSRKKGKVWVENEKKGRKIHDERFSNTFQAAFIQLVQISTGFIDCRGLRDFLVLYWIEHFQLKTGEILYYQESF